MPTVTVDGIRTRYEVRGSGPPLLMFSPGGFDATLENWSTHGIYRRTGLLDRLVEQHTCVLFDRRESGGSGGRVERVTWRDYAEQGKGLLDHLGIERAALIGGCVGCSAAAAFAVRYPQATAAMVLYSPAGGARYRMRQHARFGAHLAFAAECGPVAVVAVARSTTPGSPPTRGSGRGAACSAPTTRSRPSSPASTASATRGSWPAWSRPCSTATRCPGRSPRSC